MNFLRRFYLAVATPLLSLCIVGGVSMLSLTLAFGGPGHLKQWLQKSGVYTSAPQAIIDSSKDNGDAEGSASLNRAEVQTAFKQALTPAFVQNTAEAVIDGSYNWLQSKTPKPSYTVDLEPVKTAFAEGVSNQATARLSTLPPCGKNLPTTTDPFAMTCQPTPDVVQAAITKMNQDINSQDFLPEGRITADTSLDKPAAASPEQPSVAAPTKPANPSLPWYQQAKEAPTAYRWAVRAPWLLGLLSLLLAGSIVFAAATRRAGVKIIIITTLTAGLLLVFSAVVSLFAFNRIEASLQTGSAQNSLQRPLVTFVEAMGKFLSNIQLGWGIGLSLASVAALVALHLTKPKTTPTSPESVPGSTS